MSPATDELLEDEEERKSRVGLAILITVAIIAVLGIASYALYQILTPETATVQRVDVPNVLTYTEAQARDQLESRGLQVVVVKENGEEETQGQITAQDPVAGTSVEVNSTVTITMNEGPKTAVIPDGLVGKDVDDVERTLEGELDFTNVQTVAAKSEDPDTKPNEVVKISPKEGSTVALDAEITITYATGESEVPNFVGLTASRARDLADQAGFGEPSFTDRESDEPAGTVIDQSPNAGKKVDRDTDIKLVLAEEPEPEPEPDPDPTTTPTPTDPTTPTPTVTPS